jgi:uncharacterized protein (TIGR02145 family)
MNNVIVLNGLEWDTENLVINGKTHFAYEEAKTEAAKLGKRLPTKSEFEALLQLPHVFDEEKHGMWFAKNQIDLKSDKSLFLPAAGFTHVSLDYISDVGENGCYWSDTLYLQTKSAYRLNFNKINNGNMYMLDGKYSYTVRCVTDIKQNNMKQEEEKSFKVQIPEGYEIDKENSTFECIKFKKSKSEYPKSWEEAFEGKTINGYYITAALSQIQNYSLSKNIGKYNANVFKYQEQAESALAYAQLTQLMALPCFNGDWKPKWNNVELKYFIHSDGEKLVIGNCYSHHKFLAFRSREKAEIFLEFYKDLINIFFQNR